MACASAPACSTSILFFQCDGGPRDLHSFPTRRSSDLHRHAGIDRAGHEVRREQRRVVGLRHGDRKSTRLNSSHTVISYAVFCLKKKRESDDKPKLVILSNGVRCDCGMLGSKPTVPTRL